MKANIVIRHILQGSEVKRALLKEWRAERKITRNLHRNSPYRASDFFFAPTLEDTEGGTHA
jgi:hypothetical protein